MSPRTAELLHLRVLKIEDEHGIRSIELESADGIVLPIGGPGSHIVVLAGDHANAYSLTDAPNHSGRYSISVRHEPTGVGGSTWIHTSLEVGDVMQAHPPRNLFAPVLSSRRNIYVAGGIGVTPLLAHARAAGRSGVPFEFVFAVGDKARAPILASVRDVAGAHLTVLEGRDALLGHLRQRLKQQPIGSYLFTCGPPAMMDAVRSLARHLGWPDERVRAELFAAVQTPGAPFVAHLARSGRDIDVPADQSLLHTLTQAGVPVPSLCRQGVCGECRLPVLSGRIDHRDLYLSEEERAAGDLILSCVSRGKSRLELDL